MPSSQAVAGMATKVNAQCAYVVRLSSSFTMAAFIATRRLRQSARHRRFYSTPATLPASADRSRRRGGIQAVLGHGSEVASVRRFAEAEYAEFTAGEGRRRNVATGRVTRRGVAVTISLFAWPGMSHNRFNIVTSARQALAGRRREGAFGRREMARRRCLPSPSMA